MNQSKHTPGPWHLVHHRPNLFKVETNSAVICDTFGGLSGETMANARLIASAPDLLRALENLLSAQIDPMGIKASHARREAYEVIAKAKGQE